MKKLRLGIDLDGVVANFNVGWVGRYNEAFEASLQESEIVTWDSPLDLTHFGDMDQFWKWAREGKATIFRNLPPYEGALEALDRLARRHRIVIVSSKFDWAIPDTLAWIAQHRITAREVHFVWKKWTVDCDVFLEDAPHNLEELSEKRPDAIVCRMVRPWNQPVRGAVDVADWQAFEQLVSELEVKSG